MRSTCGAIGLLLIAAGLDAQIIRIDTGLSVLPLPVRTNSARSLQARFEVPDKGEFETTSEYARRLSARVVPSDFLPISFTGVMQPTFTYNADDGEWSIAVTELQNFLFLAETKRLLRSYEGTNAFNAKVLIRVYQKESWSIHLGDQVPTALRLRMDPARARILKPRLQAIVVSKLGSTATALTTSSHTEATFTDPEEVFLTLHSLRATDLWIWVYDSSSGRVLAKYDLGDPLSFGGGIAVADSVRKGQGSPALQTLGLSTAQIETRLKCLVGQLVVIANPPAPLGTASTSGTIENVGSISFALRLYDGRVVWHNFDEVLDVTTADRTGSVTLTFRKRN